MIPVQLPTSNLLGRDVSAHLPTAVPGTGPFRDADAAVWAAAAPYLRVRDNDGHTVYAYGLAAALLDLHPDADPDVVLPAILLHDTGWSQAPPEEVLEAIAPGGGRRDLVLLHEREGARIAREVLEGLGRDPATVDAVVAIVDGHDSRREALSLEDAVVKDADKLWRLTPHGVDTVMGWFGLTREQAHRLIVSRVEGHLLTDAARAMAAALGAVARIDVTAQRLALPR